MERFCKPLASRERGSVSGWARQTAFDTSPQGTSGLSCGSCSVLIHPVWSSENPSCDVNSLCLGPSCLHSGACACAPCLRGHPGRPDPTALQPTLSPHSDKVFQDIGRKLLCHDPIIRDPLLKSKHFPLSRPDGVKYNRIIRTRADRAALLLPPQRHYRRHPCGAARGNQDGNQRHGR